MLNSTSTICTALTSGYVPAALGACGKAVGFLAENIVSVFNTNTALNPWQPENRGKELDFAIKNDGGDLSNILTIATPIIIGTLLFASYIRSVSNHAHDKKEYDKRLLNAHSSGVDVHEYLREDATFLALKILIDTLQPLNACDIKHNFKEFISYLNQHALNDPETVKKAQQTLGVINLSDDKAPVSSFPPLLKYKALLYGSIPMSGREFVARVWNFIKNYTPHDASQESDAVEKERENCRIGFVNALAQGIEYNARVCDHGICQHIVTGVLQGRLQGVDVDGASINVAQLLTFFLQSKEIQSITTRAELSQKAREFLASIENISIENRKVFMRGVRDYASITYQG